MAVKKRKVYGYLCGIDWQHEIGQAADLEGKMPIYTDVEDLKKEKTCWESCGVVKIELKLVEWVEPQDLFKRNKNNYVDGEKT